MNNSTQFLIVTEDECAFLYNIADQNIAGPIPLFGKPTVLKTFDAF